MTPSQRPKDWKNFEDFAEGIAHNRLPRTAQLVGRSLAISLGGWCLDLQATSEQAMDWRDNQSSPSSGSAWYEAVELAPDLYWIDLVRAELAQQSLTLVVNLSTRRVLAVNSRIRAQSVADGQPRVAQDFIAGQIDDAPLHDAGQPPCPSRDLVGLRTLQVYSDRHAYEHVYLNGERYAWQCLVGVQRGQGDVDLATYYRFGPDQYVFAFREFLIPVASVFFFNFASRRSTGKFFGLTGSGEVSNRPAGAFITELSRTVYPDDVRPA